MKQEKPNIILMIMDCARADHMSCYGYQRQTTPYLDQLASRGVVYETAISPATWSIPAHWSIFTGLFLARHEVWNRHLALSPQYRTVAQMLQEVGYETVSFSNNPHIGIQNEFGRGFSTFHELFRVREERNLLNLAARATNKILLNTLNLKIDGAYRTNQMIKKWLANRPSPQQPFFLFVNYMEPHEPYQPPWPYRSRFMDQQVKMADKMARADYIISRGGRQHPGRMSDWEVEVDMALYDASLAFLDSSLRSLFSHMEQQGILDNSLVIITSDHGHSLGEHNHIGHPAAWLHDTQVWVPLIMYGPKLLPQALRVSQQVQLVDIVPTILAAVNHPQDNGRDQFLQGRSLLPKDLSGSVHPFTIIQSHYWVEGQDNQERELIAIRTDDYKYIWTPDGHDELYHLQQDPAEIHNLIDQEPAKAKELRAHLQEWLAMNGSVVDNVALEVELDEEVEERLRALGYIE